MHIYMCYMLYSIIFHYNRYCKLYTYIHTYNIRSNCCTVTYFCYIINANSLEFYTIIHCSHSKVRFSLAQLRHCIRKSNVTVCCACI